MDKQDMHSADIIAGIKKGTGLSLRKLSLKNGLNVAACQQALLRPYEKPEQIISDAIGIPAHIIWPSRFNSDGSRKFGLHSSKLKSIAKENLKHTKIDCKGTFGAESL